MPVFLTELNWIDIVFVILLIGTSYKGLRTGVGGQVISLAGTFFLLFVSITYYSYVSRGLFGFLLQRWSQPISFFLISIGIYTLIKLIERVFDALSGEALSYIERIGGVVVSLIRTGMLLGIAGMLMLQIPVGPVSSSLRNGSRTGMFFVNADIKVYKAISNLTGIPGEKQQKDFIDGILGGKKEK